MKTSFLLLVLFSTHAYGQAGPGGSRNGYSLEGRDLIEMPDSAIQPYESGVVVVEIVVDSSGSVVEAKAPQRGTTSIDSKLYRFSERMARRTKFSRDGNMPRQTGTMRFVYVIK